MRIGFNARLLSTPSLRGFNRYTVNLLDELPGLGVEPVLYTDRPIHPVHLERLKIPSDAVVSRVVRPYCLWEQVWLPKVLKRDRVELFHAPANFGLPWFSKIPKVLTLLDAIDYVYYLPRQTFAERYNRNALRSRLMMYVARTAADRVLTISPHARNDLISYLGIPASKIDVTPAAADRLFHAGASSEQRLDIHDVYRLTKPYFFYVGGWEGRKNIPFLVKAFAESSLAAQGVELVLAGGRSDEVFKLRALTDSLGVTDAVRPLGWVEDADLPALYAESLALVYPSEYEGFGLQVAEALALGTPVLAADATCLPWVLGDGGETFTLESTGELSGLLKRVVLEPGYREALVQRAQGRADAFSWRATAEATVAAYRETIASVKGSTVKPVVMNGS